ncbi:hypothetical protein C8R47DRAFT_1319313, partial [Mycena vitilis]
MLPLPPTVLIRALAKLDLALTDLAETGQVWPRGADLAGKLRRYRSAWKDYNGVALMAALTEVQKKERAVMASLEPFVQGIKERRVGRQVVAAPNSRPNPRSEGDIRGEGKCSSRFKPGSMKLGAEPTRNQKKHSVSPDADANIIASMEALRPHLYTCRRVADSRPIIREYVLRCSGSWVTGAAEASTASNLAASSKSRQKCKTF